MSDPTKTDNFDLDLLTRDDPYALTQFNGNMEKIDQEMAKPPLTVNEIEPDPETRNIQIKTVPLADNLTSDDAQLNTGTYIVRTSGGEASIANGDANLSSIKGFMEKTGYSPESLTMTVNSSTIDAELDRDVFVSYVDQSGTITLTFSSSWSADPSLYGITVNGTPANGDTIVIVYAKENRGTIAVANPSSFVSTGWNLYNHTAGYARVVNYSEEYGFMIDGTYTKLEFSETFNGTRQEIIPINGYFVVPADGYLFVTGGNATDTEIWMTWGDWTEEANGGTFEPYSQTAIDLSGLMVSFPDGLMRVGNYADEINFNTQRAISRIAKIDYSESNLETVKGYDVPYETDQNYIYYVKVDSDVFTISIDGQYSVSDHGIEMFVGTSVPLTASSLYGQDLKNKLIRGVVQISQQDLTPEQKAQVQENIGAKDVIPSILSSFLIVESVVGFDNKSLTAGDYDGDSFSIAKTGYTALGLVGYLLGNASTNGVGCTNVSLNRLTVSGSSCTYQLKNMGSGTVKVKLTVYILYRKNIST